MLGFAAEPIETANQQATAAKEQASKWANDICASAANFVENIIGQTERSLANSLGSVRQAKENIHNAIGNRE